MIVFYYYFCLLLKASHPRHLNQPQANQVNGTGMVFLSIGGRRADQFVGKVEKRPKIVATESRPAQVLAWLARKDVLNSYLHYQF